jgi:CRP-like cAMP-binding protein
MNTAAIASPGPLAASHHPVLRRLPPAWPARPAHEDLRLDENAAIQGGAWFAALSGPLRHAILGHAQLRRVAAGTRLAQRGDASAPWFGVARGAVRLGTALVDGRTFTLDFIGPGQWFGDIAAVDGQPLDLDVVAHAPSTLLVVDRPEFCRLLDHCEELRDALLQMDCARLRLMFRRFEELHTLPLSQRLARQVQQLGRQFGQVRAEGLYIGLGVSQSELAAMVGGSRQRINRAWRQMQLMGIVERAPGALLVLDPAALQAVAHGRLSLG